jgi:hypothetical protein
MNILIIIIRWKGGVGRVVKNIKRILEKKGHFVEVISREDDLNCFSTKQAFFKIRKEVKKRNYDILYTQDWSCALPLLDKKKHYVSYNGIETKKSKFLQKIIGKLMGKKLIVIGDQLKEKFPKSTLAYVGVNLEEFKNLNLKRKKNTVGFANWNNSSYNYNQIKSAVKKSKKKLIETQMKLNKKDLIKFYNQIETFISLPEKFCGFNMSWLEAMSCNVPKIIGNYNGVGKSLDINHVEDFKDIEDALKNAKVKKNYKIDPRFNWEVHTNKILKTFNKFKK